MDDGYFLLLFSNNWSHICYLSFNICSIQMDHFINHGWKKILKNEKRNWEGKNLSLLKKKKPGKGLSFDDNNNNNNNNNNKTEYHEIW